MDIRTAEDRTATLELLLNEARIEANELRARVERCRRIMASTRLVMGHELKKPVTAISGYLELAGEDVERSGLEDAARLIAKARAECELLTELNEFYLELLKLDGAGGTPHTERVDVEEVIHDVLDQAEDLRASSRVRVTIVDALPPVPVNRNALKFIILNVIENALKYSPEDAPVRVEAEVSRDLRGGSDGELLKLRVSDQGGGICAEDLKRVFRPFVRLGDDTVEGSGLGLTLVRSFVDMCDGEVSVRSERGQGTTVFVTLPLFPGTDTGGVVP
jgi:signal transduction histidine kinase